MSDAIVVAGASSKVYTLFIEDSSVTTGAGLTGLTFNTSGLTAYYKRSNGSASVAVTLASITTLGAFVSGGFREIDATNMPGLYEFDPPNTAFASGANYVTFLLKGAANMKPRRFTVQITSVNLDDGVRAGLTALPNVNSGSAGGLIVQGTGATGLTVSGGRAQADVVFINGSGNAIAGLDNFFSTCPVFTVTSATSTTITAASGVLFTTNLYQDWTMLITRTPGQQQIRQVISNTSGGVFTVDEPWTINPTSASTGMLIPLGKAALISLKHTLLAAPDTAGYPVVTIKNGTGAGEIATSSGTVTAGAVADKTGYSLSVTPPTALQIRSEMDANSLKLANLDATVSSRQATFAYTTPPSAAVIADTVLRRSTANIEASSDGDSLSARSLYGAIARLSHKLTIVGGIMTVTQSDDVTALTTAALTTDAAADPITAIDPA